MIRSRQQVLALVSVAIIGSLLYFYVNPSTSVLFPKCVFFSITSLHCPGCGSQRAIHELLHGNLLASAGHNLLVVASLPFVLFSGVAVTNNIFRSKKIGQGLFYSTKFAVAVLMLIVLFFIARNIPFEPFSWLAPGS
jgi:hypothetical protein